MTGMSVVQKGRASLMSQTFNICRVLLSQFRRMGKGLQDKLCVKVSDHGRQTGESGMGMSLTGRGLDGTAQVNDLALHPTAMCRDVGLHIVHLDLHVRPATAVEHVNALQTPF